MMPTPNDRSRERGSALIPVLIMLLSIAGMCAAMNMTTIATQRSARISHDLARAAHAADSAISFYELQLEIDGDYFIDNPAPHDARPMGTEMFTLESANPTGSNQWIIEITASCDSTDYRTFAVLGSSSITIPSGLVLSGTGNPGDDILRMNGGSTFGSYDPAVGSATLNPNGMIYANGSVRLVGTATVHGDVTVSGWISSAGPSTINGTETEGASDFALDDYDSVITPLIDGAEAANDNATLATIFGSGWSPIAGPGSPGDLSVSGGTYTVPSGTYLVGDFDVSSGASITFDTSTGPVLFVSNGGSGVDIDSGSTVQIDAGGTDNGVQLVIENGTFQVNSNSTYGQEIANPSAAGYSQILSKSSSGELRSQGGSTVYARIVAPDQEMLVGGGSSWLGAAVVREARMIGSGPKFLIDESALGTELGAGGGVEVVARWRGTVAP